MAQLSSYPSVFNTCLVLLRRDGFHVEYDKKEDQWIAVIGEFSFRADNPIELLGLGSIYRKIEPKDQSEYWWKIDEPDVLRELDPA